MLAGSGQQGVEQVIEILRAGLVPAMQFADSTVRHPLVEVGMENSRLERLVACSEARSRYWWTLGIVGLFYLALSARLGSAGSDVDEISLPLLRGLPIDARVIWSAGPTIMAFLLMGILGAFRARVAVLAELGASDYDGDELVPTFLDLLTYEPRETWWFWRMLKQFGYPVALSLFLLEAIFILWSAWIARSSIPYWPILLSIGLLSIIGVLPGLGAQWLLYARYGRAIRRGEA